jgi:hypothetical protein
MQTKDAHLAETGQAPAKPNIAGELIIPVLGVLFTIYYIVTVLDSPWTAQVNAYMVGSVLLAVSVVFFGLKFRDLIRGDVVLHVPMARGLTAIKSAQTGFILIALGYLVIMDMLGFTLATAVFFWVAMMLLDGGRRPVMKIGLSAVMALIGYLVFILMFETRLPKGPVEAILAGLV